MDVKQVHRDLLHNKYYNKYYSLDNLHIFTYYVSVFTILINENQVGLIVIRYY